jgi:predicted Rossmann fold flavoprotein
MSPHYDVIIIGAGASGLYCAAEATKRGRSVALIDHMAEAGKKIAISGGGKANFTNLSPEPQNYLCSNPYFVTSALKRYSPWDIIELIESHHITWHERDHGQLFCDRSARDLIKALLSEAKDATLMLNTSVTEIAEGFKLKTNRGNLSCESLVIATGGISMPKIGASDFGHRIARQFGHRIIQPYPALVPLRYTQEDAIHLAPLAGISIPATVRYRDHRFTEQLLFTHTGISGPVILQISSYWEMGTPLTLDLLPHSDIAQHLRHARDVTPKQQLSTVLRSLLPERLAKTVTALHLHSSPPVGGLSNADIEHIDHLLHNLSITPKSTEGFRKAEVTRGGVDCNEISSKTMESQLHKGLFFVGEVLDVIGHLGGFNFHWAWASGAAAGKCV